MAARSTALDSVALREQISARIEQGMLPAAGEQKIFGGYGSGQPCAACDAPVLQSQVLYEVEVQQQQGLIVLALHRSCFDIWMEASLLPRARTP